MNRFPKWAVLGRLALMASRLPGPGSKLVREKELAASLGLSRPTLRHYRDGVEHVRRLGDWALRRRLLRGTAMAANTFARWLRRDPDAAFEFLQLHPSFTDAQIVAAARDAGPSATGRGREAEPLAKVMRGVVQWAGEGLNRKIAIDWPPHLWDHWSFETRCEPRIPEDGRGRFLGLEIELALSLAPGPWLGGTEDMLPPIPMDQLICGVFPVPTYVVLERYRAEARSLWARLVALSLVYPLVVAVFPGPAARRYFASAIPAEIRSSWTGQSKKTEQPRRRCRSELVSFSPAPQAGTVILSTRPGLAVDLFEQARRLNVRPGHMPRNLHRRSPQQE